MREILFLLVFSCLQTSAQNWQWLRSMGINAGGQIHPDVQGGFYYSYLVNGPNFVEPKIARFDSNSNPLWTKPWAYNTSGMSCLSNNDLVVNLVQTNPINFNNDTVPANPSGGFSLVRINDTGNLITYLQFKSGNYILHLKATENNQLFLSGIIKDTLQFKTQLIVNSSQNQKRFAAICDSNFNLIWHRVIDVRADSPTILKDEDDNLVIAGKFYDTLAIDQQLNIPVSSWGEDAFVVKMSPAGQILWNRITSGVTSFDVSLDKFNNIYLGGEFRDSLRQDEAFLSYECNCNINVREEAFALRFSTNGTRQWLTHIGKNVARGDLHFFASPGGYLYFAGETEGDLQVDTTSMSQNWGWQGRMGAIAPNGQLAWTEVPKQNFCSISNVYFNKNSEAFFYGFAKFLKIGSDSIESPYANMALKFVAKISLEELPVMVQSYNSDPAVIHTYPNPCREHLNIESTYPLPVLASIFSIDGRNRFSSWLKTNDDRLHLPPLESGTYVLHLKRGDGNVFRKLILIE
jgi:hypothetical protein